MSIRHRLARFAAIASRPEVLRPGPRNLDIAGAEPGDAVRFAQPPRLSTTLRQGSDSFALLARRQAFISGGLPICSAQSFPASERQAICSSRLGPDWADAKAQPASSSTSETRTDFFMDHLWAL